MNLNLKIKKAVLILDRGSTDRLHLTLDRETPFPEMNYPACLSMEFRQGYGLELIPK